MAAVVTLKHGSPVYRRTLGQIQENSWLVRRMWEDAESKPEELDKPGTLWTVVLVGGFPASWCAARLIREDGGTKILKCHSNYVHPGYRELGLYELAYHRRHSSVVVPAAARGISAVTYLFPEPIELHLRDGWRRTGISDVGFFPHHNWQELRRFARQ